MSLLTLTRACVQLSLRLRYANYQGGKGARVGYYSSVNFPWRILLDGESTEAEKAFFVLMIDRAQGKITSRTFMQR